MWCCFLVDYIYICIQQINKIQYVRVSLRRASTVDVGWWASINCWKGRHHLLIHFVKILLAFFAYISEAITMIFFSIKYNRVFLYIFHHYHWAHHHHHLYPPLNMMIFIIAIIKVIPWVIMFYSEYLQHLYEYREWGW